MQRESLAASTNPSYTGSRPDLRALVPFGTETVLDVGCNTGRLGAALKRERRCVVYGIEIDPISAALASAELDQVVVGDVDTESTWTSLGERRFDCVLLGDVLEHCRDPWRVLAQARRRLSPQGTAIISLPNVAHLSTHLALLRREWPYNSRGIHDATHLRWFAERNALSMVVEAGLEVSSFHRSYRLIEAPHPINRYARYMAVPGLKNLLTHQFIIVARLESQ